MKKYLYLVLFLLIGGMLHAQSWRFAPTFGVQVATVNYSSAYKKEITSFNSAYSNASVQTAPTLKVQIGALFDYPFSDRLSFRTGLVYNGKGGAMTYKVSDYGVTAKFKGTNSINYLELPLIVSTAVGTNDFRLEIGVVGGLAVSAKTKYTGSESGNYYAESTLKLPIGNDKVDEVKPTELGFSVSVVKQLEVNRSPLEIGVHIQPSLSKWNSSSKYQPDYFARNLLIGVKAVYLLDL
ncbi:outer membrane beta-barrel protein [Siphonobacter curvatus]|uniref:Outer membrane protein beta-barrel domain-containing protein n=1 Tax=Siphonobacter curvatus TaxID=2094562 RepID=A0A2S7IJI5_9BACT|nr:outer membrane beta-barrel protein [Siphonobacter curvatus]PQA56357.1 hypothetical protein C5O19_18640 [Siphonobacter curvatus]